VCPTYDLAGVEPKTALQGYRTARGSHTVQLGNWYFEVEITTPAEAPQGHTRIGWSTERGEVSVIRDNCLVWLLSFLSLTFFFQLQAPAGFDHYSYSYRDVDGSVFHQSRGKPYGQSYGSNPFLMNLLNCTSRTTCTCTCTNHCNGASIVCTAEAINAPCLQAQET
jgi:hypothetical protein